MHLLCDRTATQQYTDPTTGKSYFSFSQVAQVLDPEVYSRIDPDVLGRAQVRGTRLHYLFAFLLGSRAGWCEAPEVPEEWAGYYRAMVRWADAHHVSPMLIEEPSIWQDCAGTPDAKVRYGSTGMVTLPDLKTGTIRSRLHRVQVQVYSQMAEYRDCRQLVVLYVQPDGTYEEMIVQPDPFDLAWFGNGLAVLRGRLQGGL